jgi:lipopolysaccharide/colanic/teichoic acid biosynthesis glycosyltransferase
MLSDTSGNLIIITGASGFLGRSLVPALAKDGYRLLLCGRDPARLEVLYPDHRFCTLEQLPEKAQGALTLIHLAVMNNDTAADDAMFYEANVSMLQRIVELGREAGIAHVIYPASLQADANATTAYGRSKFAAEEFLAGQSDIVVTFLRLPAVYGEAFKGKLSILNKLPGITRGPLLTVLGSLKPVVNIERVVSAILGTVKQPQRETVWVTDPQSHNFVYRALSRLMDLGFAVAVSVLLWWLLIAVWIGIKVTTKGPGLFAQERVGRAQLPFICYKFRTMQQGTEQAGTHEVSQASVTGIGRFLRRTKIDELPQIWNLIKGDMSLVGPRPCLLIQQELRDARQRHGVFDIRPGLTGFAQIQGVDMSVPEKLAMIDAQYIAIRTILLDLKIVLNTVRGGGDNTAA